MKHVFQELTEEEISKLNLKQLQEKIKEIGKIYNVLRKTSEVIIEKKIKEVVSDYDDIKYIDITTHYPKIKHFDDRYSIYIDNKFYSEEMIFNFSYNKNRFYVLEQKIYKKLTPLRYLFKKNISFDIHELKTKYKYLNRKLEKNISVKQDNKTKYLQQNNTLIEFKEITEEEILKLTPEQLKTKIEEIEKIYNSLDRMIEPIVEKKLSEIVAYNDIKNIKIIPYVSYNKKEDQSGPYTIYIIGNIAHEFFIKGDAPKLNSLRDKIYKELAPLKYFIQKDMKFNISELRAKHMYYELDRDISINNYQRKSYKI